MITTRARWIVPVAAVAGVAMLWAPGRAQANEAHFGSSVAVSDASNVTCLSAGRPVFAGLGDARLYVLAPNGTFDGGQGDWQLLDGASLASDPARGAGLALPPGGSAISPAFCVDLDFPHLRLAHKVTGAHAGDFELNVEVVYLESESPVWTETKRFDGAQGDVVDAGWRISPDVDLKPDLGGGDSGQRLAALRFSAIDKRSSEPDEDEDAPPPSSSPGAILVDDVFLDPRMRS